MMLKFEERTLRLLSFWLAKKIDGKGKNVYRYEEELVDGKNDFMVKNETIILDRLLKYVPKETGTGRKLSDMLLTELSKAVCLLL